MRQTNIPDGINNLFAVNFSTEGTATENGQEKAGTVRFAGYAALIERYGLDVMPDWRSLLVTTSGTHRIEEGCHRGDLPPKYWLGGGIGDHLEFAI